MEVLKSMEINEAFCGYESIHAQKVSYLEIHSI